MCEENIMQKYIINSDLIKDINTLINNGVYQFKVGDINEIMRNFNTLKEYKETTITKEKK